MDADELTVQKHIELIFSVDISQLLHFRLKYFRRLQGGNKSQFLHRIQGIVIQINLRSRIAFPSAPAYISINHEEYISRFIHLENFKFVPAVKGTLILSVWIIKRK